MYRIGKWRKCSGEETSVGSANQSIFLLGCETYLHRSHKIHANLHLLTQLNWQVRDCNRQNSAWLSEWLVELSPLNDWMKNWRAFVEISRTDEVKEYSFYFFQSSVLGFVIAVRVRSMRLLVLGGTLQRQDVFALKIMRGCCCLFSGKAAI